MSIARVDKSVDKSLALTPKQLRVLEVAQEPRLRANITQLCEEAECSREIFYRWLREDSLFRLAWQNLWKPALTRNLPMIIAAIVQKALNGDPVAQKLAVQLAGIYSDKVEVLDWRKEAELSGVDPEKISAVYEKMVEQFQLAMDTVEKNGDSPRVELPIDIEATEIIDGELSIDIDNRSGGE